MTTSSTPWDFELCALRDAIYADAGGPQFNLRDAAACALGQLVQLAQYAADWDAMVAAMRQPEPPTTPAARKAAYHLANGTQPIPHAGGYLVSSGTRSNVIHFVSAEGVCSCEAGQHGRSCWHVAAVQPKRAA